MSGLKNITKVLALIFAATVFNTACENGKLNLRTYKSELPDKDWVYKLNPLLIQRDGFISKGLQPEQVTDQPGTNTAAILNTTRIEGCVTTGVYGSSTSCDTLESSTHIPEINNLRACFALAFNRSLAQPDDPPTIASCLDSNGNTQATYKCDSEHSGTLRVTCSQTSGERNDLKTVQRVGFISEGIQPEEISSLPGTNHAAILKLEPSSNTDGTASSSPIPEINNLRSCFTLAYEAAQKNGQAATASCIDSGGNAKAVYNCRGHILGPIGFFVTCQQTAPDSAVSKEKQALSSNSAHP